MEVNIALSALKALYWSKGAA